ncbi:MAG: FAD-dependent oxidoreductase, partial [Catalinimonas sp.]
VVVAVDAPAAAALGAPGPPAKTEHVSTGQLYFEAPRPTLTDSIIVLPTAAGGIVSNLANMSAVAPDYAPEGRTLIQVSVGGNVEPGDDLPARVRGELRPWFADVDGWQHLRSYRVDYALPDQAHVRHDPTRDDLRPTAGVYRAGDHLLNGSLNAALRTGRLAAEAVAADLG